MYKIDLHTHSTASPDGGITAKQYEEIIVTGVLDYVAITDHNTISNAKKLFQSFGDKIIVGEEIMTASGEIVGLYLDEKIPSGLTAVDTIKLIKGQGGLVYIPHPLESFRNGLKLNVLEDLVGLIDIVEIGNGRSLLQSKYTQTLVWANLNHLAGAASSDAHGKRGIGRSYTSISDPPTKHNLTNLLKHGVPVLKKPSVRALLYPKYNRLNKKLH